MTFPAFTFCLTTNWKNGKFETFELTNEILAFCGFDGLKEFNLEDFERLKIWHFYDDFGLKLNCYRLNGGKDSLGNPKEIYKSIKVGAGSGLRLSMNLSSEDFIYYHIEDNTDYSTNSDLIQYVQSNILYFKNIIKVVDEKLPEPYNPCLKKDSIEKFGAYLVKEIMNTDRNYRQANCFDLWYQNHIESLIQSKNISISQAIMNSSDFNTYKDCKYLCPLECDSINFELSGPDTSLTDDQFSYQSNYLNSSLNYTKEKLLVLRVQFKQMKYIQMSQSIQMTSTDLLSNIGGILGIFLEISFLTIYRILYLAFKR